MRLVKLLVGVSFLVAVASVLVHRCLLDTPLPEGVEDPGPLRQLVPTYNLIFYGSAAAWMAGVTTRVFEPVKFVLGLIRSRNSAVIFQGLESHVEFVDRPDGTKMPLKVDAPGSLKSPSDPDKPAAAPSPCILFLHGGGYTLNNPSAYHHVTGNLSSSLGLPVFSPDYRKSPQWIQPAALDDSELAWRHLRGSARRYGIDPDRIIVAGDSGGGHLAIGLTLRLLSSSERPPLGLVLIYPATQLLTSALPSQLENRLDVFLSESTATAMRLSYLVGDTADLQVWRANNHSTPRIRAEFARQFNLPLLTNGDNGRVQGSAGSGLDWAVQKYRFAYDDWLLSPLFAPDHLLAGFPASLTQTCQFDILRDEGRMFHDRLARAGVAGLELRHYSSVHGMYGFLPAGHRPAVAAMQDVKAFVRSVLENH